MAMNDEQRKSLAEKLDRDLDAFIEKQKIQTAKRRKENPEPELELDELVAELKDHPAFLTELDPSKPLPPLVEGIQQMKYAGDDTTENAESYKDDGNNNFKLKKYRWAIDAYTEGIKIRCPDRLINAQLYNNRAASHFNIGNHRTAFLDCVVARKFKPDYIKAIIKGAQCSMERRRYEDAIMWCDDALLLTPTDKKMLDMRAKAEKLKKQQERDARKQAAQERKKLAEKKKLIDTIRARGVTIEGVVDKHNLEAEAEDDQDRFLLSSLEAHHPCGAQVHVDSSGRLVWPVMFVYPEHTQSDFIEAFNEDTCFVEQFEAMFGAGSSPPPWDLDKKYKPADFELFFEEKKEEKLYRIKPTSTLESVLKNPKFTVHGGTPVFIILVKDSDFAKSFLKKYATSN